MHKFLVSWNVMIEPAMYVPLYGELGEPVEILHLLSLKVGFVPIVLS